MRVCVRECIGAFPAPVTPNEKHSGSPCPRAFRVPCRKSCYRWTCTRPAGAAEAWELAGPPVWEAQAAPDAKATRVPRLGPPWPAQPARSPAGEAISPAFRPSRPSHAACLARHGQQTTTGTSLSPFRSTVYVKVNVHSGRSCGSGIPDASVLGSHTWLCIGLRQPAPGDAPAPGHALHVPETHSESR